MKEIVMEILFTIITGCGMFLVKKIVDFINAKIDELETTTGLAEHEQLSKYINDAQEIISNTVTMVSQTFVDSLKASGKFDKESAETAKNMALTTAKELISEESKEAIATVYGDFNTYLNTTIEATVKNNKISVKEDIIVTK